MKTHVVENLNWNIEELICVVCVRAVDCAVLILKEIYFSQARLGSLFVRTGCGGRDIILT